MKIAIEHHVSTILEYQEEEYVWLHKYLSIQQNKFRKNYQTGRMERVGIETIPFVDSKGRFPTGFIPGIVRKGKQLGFKFTFEDRRPTVAVAPAADVDISFLRYYQQNAIERVIARKRGVIKQPTGCLTGDTELIVGRGGGVRRRTLEQVVLRMSTLRKRSGRYRWDPNIPTYVQSVDNLGSVVKNKIIEAHDNGEAQVFCVRTSTGRTIRGTAEHLFMTSEGWRKLSDLTIGTAVVVAAHPKDIPRVLQPKRQYKTVAHMWNHPYGQVSYTGRMERLCRVPLHRLVAEASTNEMTTAELVGRIVLNDIDGLLFFDPKEIHVHHIDGNVLNNATNNLQPLPASEHESQHGTNSNWRNVVWRTTTEEITEIEEDGIERVFDLTMCTPLDNYVANGFVVHNSGKTVLAAGLVKKIPCKWVFVVQSKDLLHQTYRKYKQFVGKEAGLIGDGIFRPPEDEANLIIATAQTLNAKLKNEVVWKYIRDAEGIIIDECHSVPASTIIQILMTAQKAAYRIGLSATPLARGDQKSMLTIGALGDIIHKVDPPELIAAGFLSRPSIEMWHCTQTCDRPTYQGRYNECVVKSARRNKLVAQLMQKATTPSLTFVQRIDHGKTLLKRAQKQGLKVEFVWGKLSSTQRQAAVKRLVRGDIDHIICSAVFVMGIDIPELRSIINAAAGLSTIATLQRIGRGSRITANKNSFEVFDILDLGVDNLENHAKARRREYKREGYGVREVEESASV